MDSQELKNLWQNIVFSAVQHGKPTGDAIELANSIVDGYRKKFSDDGKVPQRETKEIK